MPKNYLIGIGGTGARVAESLLHLCASGLGPEELTLFLVDSDRSNGNLSRTTGLLATYQRAREGLKSRPGSLFRTEVKTPRTAVWHIFDKAKIKLKDYIGLANLRQRHSGLADLVSLLFSEEELTTNLDEGFRGHPSIGAVAMSNVDETKEPWKLLYDDIATSTTEIRVFLVGSIFGGTGAAGVPTFATPTMLKERGRTKEGSRVRLGGALVLPYFVFAPDPGEKEMHVTPADFPIATKGALQYYYGRDLGFDRMYLLGDSLGQEVGEFSPGSQDQENRPHYVEMIAALAAVDFYVEDSGRDKIEQEYYIAKRERSTPVDWEAFPVARRGKEVGPRRINFKRQLATMTAFCYALLDYGMPLLEKSPDEVLDAWYRDHFYAKRFFLTPKVAVDLRQAEHKKEIQDLADYARKFLCWVVEMDEEELRLIDSGQLGTIDVNGEFQTYDHDRHPHAIGSFLHSSSAKDVTFDDFLNTLNTVESPLKNSPPERYIDLLYQAASRFLDTHHLAIARKES